MWRWGVEWKPRGRNSNQGEKCGGWMMKMCKGNSRINWFWGRMMWMGYGRRQEIVCWMRQVRHVDGQKDHQGTCKHGGGMKRLRRRWMRSQWPCNKIELLSLWFACLVIKCTTMVTLFGVTIVMYLIRILRGSCNYCMSCWLKSWVFIMSLFFRICFALYFMNLSAATRFYVFIALLTILHRVVALGLAFSIDI